MLDGVSSVLFFFLFNSPSPFPHPVSGHSASELIPEHGCCAVMATVNSERLIARRILRYHLFIGKLLSEEERFGSES